MGVWNSRVRECLFKVSFEDKDAIEIYDLLGKPIKIFDSGSVDVFMVSHNQQLVAVTIGDLDYDSVRMYFVIYDMNGNETWRKETFSGVHPQIEFSQDDKYVALKMPNYFKNPRDGKSGGAKWVYVFRVSDGRLISEGNYDD